MEENKRFKQANYIYRTLAEKSNLGYLKENKDYMRCGSFGNLFYGGKVNENEWGADVQYHVMDKETHQYLGCLFCNEYGKLRQSPEIGHSEIIIKHVLVIKTPNCIDGDMIDTCYDGDTTLNRTFNGDIKFHSRTLHVIHSQKENPDEFLNNFCEIIDKNIDLQKDLENDIKLKQIHFADEQLSKFEMTDPKNLLEEVEHKQTQDAKLAKLDITTQASNLIKNSAVEHERN